MMPLLVMSMPSRPAWIMEGHRRAMERWFPMADVKRIEVVDGQPFGAALRCALSPYQDEEPVTVWLDDMWLSATLSQAMVDEAYFLVEQGASSVRWAGAACEFYQFDDPRRTPGLLAKRSQYLLSLCPGIHRVDFLRNHIRMTDSPWDVEIAGTKRVRDSWPHRIICLDFIHWQNMVIRGMLNQKPAVHDLIKELGIDLNS